MLLTTIADVVLMWLLNLTTPWPQIMNLKLEDVGAQRSFLFLWCGSCEGLDLGREVRPSISR